MVIIHNHTVHTHTIHTGNYFMNKHHLLLLLFVCATAPITFGANHAIQLMPTRCIEVGIINASTIGRADDPRATNRLFVPLNSFISTGNHYIVDIDSPNGPKELTCTNPHLLKALNYSCAGRYDGVPCIRLALLGDSQSFAGLPTEPQATEMVYVPLKNIFRTRERDGIHLRYKEIDRGVSDELFHALGGMDSPKACPKFELHSSTLACISHDKQNAPVIALLKSPCGVYSLPAGSCNWRCSLRCALDTFFTETRALYGRRPQKECDPHPAQRIDRKIALQHSRYMNQQIVNTYPIRNPLVMTHETRDYKTVMQIYPVYVDYRTMSEKSRLQFVPLKTLQLALTSNKKEKKIGQNDQKTYTLLPKTKLAIKKHSRCLHMIAQLQKYHSNT